MDKTPGSGAGGLYCASRGHHAYINACKATNSSLSPSPRTKQHSAKGSPAGEVGRGELTAQRVTPATLYQVQAM